MPTLDPSLVAALVRAFPHVEDGSAIKSRELVTMLLECTAAPFSRDQFTPGHITCTGFVLDPAGERVLLVHHRRLNRWLLPGGHVEPDDAAISDAARREVSEETGAVLDAAIAPVLTGIDVHGIPGKGREPYHLHHDLIFGFRALTEVIRVSPESHEVIWCPRNRFDELAVPANVYRCWERLART